MAQDFPRDTTVQSNPIGTISLKTFLWKPQKDITTYELAVSLPLLMGIVRDSAMAVENAPPEVRRHFEEYRR